MKTILITLGAIMMIHLAQAQTIAGKYLATMPALPSDSCNVTKKEAAVFKQQVAGFIEKVETGIDSLNSTLEQESETNEKTAMAHAKRQLSEQYGLSAEDLKKLENDKLSDADAQALAAKILQQQTNMSMSEVRNFSKMSKSGQEAYAEALGAEMKAEVEANPAKGQTGANLKDRNRLINQQQAVMKRVNDASGEIGRLYAVVESNNNLKKSHEKIDGWKQEVYRLMGVEREQGAVMDSLIQKIKEEQIIICDTYTPQYRYALKRHLILLKTLVPDIYRLGEIGSQLSEAQTGIGTPAESLEASCLEAVKGYLYKLREAYRFKLYFPEEGDSSVMLQTM